MVDSRRSLAGHHHLGTHRDILNRLWPDMIANAECISWPIAVYPISIVSYRPAPMAISFSIDKMHLTAHAYELVLVHLLHSVESVDFSTLNYKKFTELTYHRTSYFLSQKSRRITYLLNNPHQNQSRRHHFPPISTGIPIVCFQTFSHSKRIIDFNFHFTKFF